MSIALLRLLANNGLFFSTFSFLQYFHSRRSVITICMMEIAFSVFFTADKWGIQPFNV